MSLVVVMNCGAENALRGFEISMFYFFKNFILYTYPKIYCHCGHLMLWNNVNNTFPESYNVKDYENIKIGKSAIMQGCTAAPYIMHDF